MDVDVDVEMGETEGAERGMNGGSGSVGEIARKGGSGNRVADIVLRRREKRDDDDDDGDDDDKIATGGSICNVLACNVYLLYKSVRSSSLTGVLIIP